MLSVILCTHNPRPDFLRRTLDGLRAQSLATKEWELILIDNASRHPVAEQIDLGWHQATSVVREEEVGLTAARLRGIKAANSDLLVWVDDDNILASDYLAQAVELSRAWPKLGVWGCGCYEPEWEVAPPAEFAPYLDYLAVRSIARDRWSNQAGDYAATPAGAGICVRREVAQGYANRVRTDPRRKALGRTGTNLAACEDHDLAFCAIDLGYGTGVFTALRLTHLMPANRVREDYLLRLVEGHACSTVILMALRDPMLRAPAVGWPDRARRWRLHRSLNKIERNIQAARERGEEQAWQILRSWAISAKINGRADG